MVNSTKALGPVFHPISSHQSTIHELKAPSFSMHTCVSSSIAPPWPASCLCNHLLTQVWLAFDFMTTLPKGASFHGSKSPSSREWIRTAPSTYPLVGLELPPNALKSFARLSSLLQCASAASNQHTLCSSSLLAKTSPHQA